METLSTFLGHNTFNEISISNWRKQFQLTSKLNTTQKKKKTKSDHTQSLYLRVSIWADNRSSEWPADIPAV